MKTPALPDGAERLPDRPGQMNREKKMAQISARPEIGPEIIKKLAAGNGAICISAFMVRAD